MLNTLNRLLGRAALASLVYLGCLGLAQAQTSTINVQAKADLADNVGAIMQVRLNAVVIGSVEVRSTTWQVYSFSAPSASLSGGAIDVVFTNDALINGQDRNLRVLSVDVNGLSLSPTASSVVYDRGTGAAAFDGLDTYPGSNVMPWSGAMRFASLPGAISLPSSPAPVANYEYDAQGNPTKTIQAPGVSGFNFATQSSYDKLSRQKDTTNAKSGLTQFGYNGREDLTQVTDPRNLITQYPRNGLGDATSVVSPDTGTATQTYDAAGNLKTRTDSRGVLATYSYDALNRLTGIVYTQTGQATRTYAWTYDQTGTGFSNGVGRLTSTSFPAGSTQYTYDAQGRLLTNTQRVLATTGANSAQISTTVGYTYDAAGHITSVTYPSGRKLSVTYSNGLPSALALGKDAVTTPVNLISAIQWESFGGVKSWLWQIGAGTELHERRYDSAGRVVRYRLGGVMRDISYDAADRITAYTHYEIVTGTATAAATALNQSFTYDELGRLTGVSAAGSSWTIAYDANGNRTSTTLNGTTRAYTTPATNNRLSGLTNPARGLSYDSAGNIVSDGKSFTFSLEGSLALAAVPGYSYVSNGTTFNVPAVVVGAYDYNGFYQRVRKFAGSGAASTVIFVYDQNGQLLGEYNSAGVAIREYVWLGDTPVAVFTPDPANAANPPLVYYIHTDHLNTPRVVLNTANVVRWNWLAEPFGTTAPNTNPASAGAFTFNLRFPGQYADSEGSLFYNMARLYDPTIGRYTQSDPIGLQGGINTYAYVEGNPLSLVDPLGLATYMCTQPLNALGAAGRMVHSPSSNPLYHQFIGIVRPDGSAITGGQDRAGGPWSPGKPSEGDGAPGSGAECKKVEDDNECLEQCLIGKFAAPRPKYSLVLQSLTGGQNCQGWSDSTLAQCQASCRAKR